MAAAGNKAEIVRAIFAAYLADDRRTVEQAFADDFRFNTPYGENIDKPRYFAECWRSSDWISRHEIERIMVEGGEVFVTYRCVAKDGKSFRNTEFFVFDGDKVKRIDVYFGPSHQDGALVRQDR
ncbi:MULTISPECIES: nuclear transport factor 2 family protein [unclassified Bradyrhizobium]|uniref:nuclear transport factor 2 family protein n=1 Tax=unclassified Bradyrhizobium TaxID=2631580 RepID=UPI00247B2628|nr:MULTISPECIES: nuclear transport factor 2 family protein [unclassified Bradyrhizobium]WGS19808.1 nuclear transport factor 2 family protein [Bradyrhizobium sp. ISRA463]WGS26656.1 nuclear transport factor 2 family protein [Bradyrhizobium sp. ISRA464]